MIRYAISDIHGCSKTFKALLEKIQLSKTDELYLLGDYVDRGPNSKGVIDYIWQLQKEGYTVNCLKGNHEEMMIQARHHSGAKNMWIKNGGFETLQSFNTVDVRDVSLDYFSWMVQLPLYFEVENYILVHAGLRFGVGDVLDHKEAMLWQRNWYNNIDYEWLGNRMIVHGHTPIFTKFIKAQLSQLSSKQYLDIDNGCCYSKLGFNKLTAFDMTNQKIYFQANID